MSNEKKLTIRLNMDYEYHRLILEKIKSRDRYRYKSLADYICETVASFEGTEGNSERGLLTEEERHLISREIAEAIKQELAEIAGKQNNIPEQRPGY